MLCTSKTENTEVSKQVRKELLALTNFHYQTKLMEGSPLGKESIMKKNIFRIFSLLLAIAIVTSSFATAAFASSETYEETQIEYQGETASRGEEPARGLPYLTSVWLTGRFNGNSWSTSHRFVVDNSRVTPKFKVYTYNANGNSTSGRFSIRVTTPQDSSYIRTYYNKSNGCTITLDKGYSQYNIQICRYGTNSTNVANCYYWAFKATSSDSGWMY